MMADDSQKNLEHLRRLAAALPSLDEEEVPDIDTALKNEGMDVDVITNWSNDLAQQVQGQLRLHAAGQKRAGIVEKMTKLREEIATAATPLKKEIYSRIEALSFSKKGDVAMFCRKFEEASSEEDLRSLFEDLEMLEDLEGEEDSQ